MHWHRLLYRVLSILASLGYGLLFLGAGVAFLQLAAVLILWGHSFQRDGPDAFVRVLLALAGMLAVMAVSLVLSVAHWRTRAQPHRRVLIASTLMAGLLLALAVSVTVGWTKAQPSVALTLWSLAILLLTCCYVGWRLQRPDG